MSNPSAEEKLEEKFEEEKHVSGSVSGELSGNESSPIMKNCATSDSLQEMERIFTEKEENYKEQISVLEQQVLKLEYVTPHSKAYSEPSQTSKMEPFRGNIQWLKSLKSVSLHPKKLFYSRQLKPFKSDENCFLFDLKSSFLS